MAVRDLDVTPSSGRPSRLKHDLKAAYYNVRVTDCQPAAANIAPLKCASAIFVSRRGVEITSVEGMTLTWRCRSDGQWLPELACSIAAGKGLIWTPGTDREPDFARGCAGPGKMETYEHVSRPAGLCGRPWRQPAEQCGLLRGLEPFRLAAMVIGWPCFAAPGWSVMDCAALLWPPCVGLISSFSLL